MAFQKESTSLQQSQHNVTEHTVLCVCFSPRNNFVDAFTTRWQPKFWNSPAKMDVVK
jgi:hypothetical protein